jgi:hypothetical protein
MLKGVISFYDGSPSLTVVMGLGEDLKAPRDLAALEKQGWIINDEIELAYKAFLAGKRQGDIDSGVKFEDWAATVGEIDARPSRKQIEQAVALGGMTQEQADALLSTYGDDGEGEAVTPLS